MTIAVASGKGGAGKTSMTAALAASFGKACVVADCDVDAANGAIALGASLRESEPYFAGPGFSIDPAACVACGACAKTCRFGAVRPRPGEGGYAIVPELCERCGACLDRCPAGAVVASEKEAGKLFVSDSRLGARLAHAELAPGEDTSGKLVRKVRDRADELAGPEDAVLVDAPPGIGCPVIASLSGTQLVVVVEASHSGIRDAKRLVELAASMRRGAVAVINKAGLDPAMDEEARAALREAGLPLAGEIPFDPSLRSAEERGKTWLDVEGEAGCRVRSAVAALRGLIDGLGRKSANLDT
ncbi:MAG: 4Fe-4S binding protein [Spirochaetaceae bacterium]|nr:4Fe-4S binding protein [Spirochaetaceae bacterium]